MPCFALTTHFHRPQSAREVAQKMGASKPPLTEQTTPVIISIITHDHSALRGHTLGDIGVLESCGGGGCSFDVKYWVLGHQLASFSTELLTELARYGALLASPLAAFTAHFDISPPRCLRRLPCAALSPTPTPSAPRPRFCPVLSTSPAAAASPLVGGGGGGGSGACGWRRR